MSFGPHTTLTLMVDACATLPEVKTDDIAQHIDSEVRESAKRDFNDAKTKQEEAFKLLLEAVPQPGPILPDSSLQAEIDRKQKAYVDAANNYQKAKLKYDQLRREEGEEQKKIRPNAFVTVTLDEDVQNTTPIVFTKTYRSDRRPFWHESFSDIPIGLLAHGKWGRQLLSGTQSPYCPTRLNFWIYHDIGDDTDSSKDSWKRDSPRRDFLIGRACLNFGSLVCNGCETWHELPVLDNFENPLSECKLRVKTQMSSAFAIHNSGTAVVQRPLNLPGGLVCGEAEDNTCQCGNDCGGACVNQAMHFQRPPRKHKSCKAKRKKCKHHNRYCHH